MLWLKNITKTYVTGGEKVEALKGVSLGFRDCELVAILGPSGCGKTTLLNIIGGLDRYSTGDLIIGGRSTKEYDDADWDSYRNHSIGFVFQTYNLIPHQTVLANVELALTLSGVGRSERRKRAVDALKAVGLGDQLHKKPNQMSGGQMQRVAIARALVNNPDILLADEPTGALDTDTSIQVMNILKEVARDRLVIMVTHNPDLAATYATRTVRVLDGLVIDDTQPVDEAELEAECAKAQPKKNKKTSMSFVTALSLSLNNLLTKKARTILTSFAGSIGIIGIALILSMSSGFQNYINRVQEDTLSTYPIAIQAETMDMSSLISAFAGRNNGGGENDDGTKPAVSETVHSTDAAGDIYSTLQQQVRNNDIEGFYRFIQDNQPRFDKLVSAIQYKYDLALNVYNVKSEFGITRANPSSVSDALESSYSGFSMFMNSSSWDVWSEMIDNQKLLSEQYDVVSGRWPSEYNEVVLVVGRNNGINVLSLYTLGMLDQSELADKMTALAEGKPYEKESVSYTFDEIVYGGEGDEDYWSFNLVINSDYFTENEDGTWNDRRKDKTYVEDLARAGEEIKVVGIIRPSENSVAGSIDGAIAYTPALTNYVIEKVSAGKVIAAQKADDTTDIFTGMPFRSTFKKTDEVKAAYFKVEVFDNETFTKTEKADMMRKIRAGGLTEEQKAELLKSRLEGKSDDEIKALMTSKFTELKKDAARLAEFSKKYAAVMQKMMSEGTLTEEEILPMMLDLAGDELVSEDTLTDDDLALLFDDYVENGSDEELAALYTEYCLSEATYDGNMEILSVVDKSSPESIYIYPSDFAGKEKVMELIDEYNAANPAEENQITYTDYIGIFISSVSTIIDAISYVLIGFVSISLVVSSIMIGVITYISVLERTKEIGILRSIGASKHDVRTVFNAETFIVGAISGLMGIAITLILIVPINMIIYSLAGISNIAALPWLGGILLVAISIGLTVFAGLIPSGLAAKRDPVVALRSE